MYPAIYEVINANSITQLGNIDFNMASFLPSSVTYLVTAYSITLLAFRGAKGAVTRAEGPKLQAVTSRLQTALYTHSNGPCLCVYLCICVFVYLHVSVSVCVSCPWVEGNSRRGDG